jgi:hypothetical protein
VERAGIRLKWWRMSWLSKIWELGLDTGHYWINYVWPVSRSINFGIEGSLMWEMHWLLFCKN